mgnify:CR=1 FL=1
MLQMTRQMIFQDSASSLNPGMKVRDIVAEPLRIQSRKIRTDKKEIEKQLEMVGPVSYTHLTLPTNSRV